MQKILMLSSMILLTVLLVGSVIADTDLQPAGSNPGASSWGNKDMLPPGSNDGSGDLGNKDLLPAGSNAGESHYTTPAAGNNAPSPGSGVY